MKHEYTLMELSEKTGISPRNIRYYISKNLLGGPAQVGRNAVYTQKHLAQLLNIKEKKERGLSLHEIATEAEDRQISLGEPSVWVQYTLAEDIKVSVHSEISPWRMQQIKRALSKILPYLQKNGEKK